MTARGAHHLGPRRDVRNVIIAVLRQATEPLTTPQIIRLARLKRSTAFQHLRELETEGLVQRLSNGGGRTCAHLPRRFIGRAGDRSGRNE